MATGKYSDKKRLIVDLSAPHSDSNNPSINELISKELSSLSYVRIDDAIELINSIGPGAIMCKVDILDAFKLLPIHPSQWQYYYLQLEQCYYFYQRLVFGCRSSPKIFDAFATSLCWIALNNYDVGNILHLLDDFITINSPSIDGVGTMNNLKMMFSYLQIPLTNHKTEGLSCEVEYLGIILDSVRMEAMLQQNKLDRLRAKIAYFESRQTVSKLELLQLLGHLALRHELYVL